MAGKCVYFDSNFLIYFLELHEPQFSAVLPLIQACDSGLIQGATGDAAVAEVMVLRYRKVMPSRLREPRIFLPVKILCLFCNMILHALIRLRCFAQKWE
jgi:predicted nucleic acid-binding protein